MAPTGRGPYGHPRGTVGRIYKEDHYSLLQTKYEKVQVGKDQEKAQSEKDSHSKNRGGKKTNRYLYHETYRKPNEQLFSQ